MTFQRLDTISVLLFYRPECSGGQSVARAHDTVDSGGRKLKTEPPTRVSIRVPALIERLINRELASQNQGLIMEIPVAELIVLVCHQQQQQQPSDRMFFVRLQPGGRSEELPEPTLH